MTIDHLTQTEVEACKIQVGWLLEDRSMLGAHGQLIVVEWTGHHVTRKRTYIAGIEELSRNPVTVAYDDSKVVKVWKP